MQTKLFKKPETYCYLFILLGIFFRLKFYFANTSFWLDEVSLALNVIDRDFIGLFLPLDYHQGCPIFFLLITKMFSFIFGESEYVLRLIPITTAIASLFVFHQLTNTIFTNKIAKVFAVVLFALNTRLIYYAQEFKQYSSDVMFALLALLFAFKFDFSNNNYQKCLIYGSAFAIGMWFSHPLLFIIAGLISVNFFYYLFKKNYSPITKIFVFSAPIFLSFVLFYVMSLSSISSNSTLINYWSDGFFSANILDSFLVFVRGFRFCIPFTSYILILLIIFAVGCVSFYKEDKFKFFFLISPMIFCFIASFLHFYPFADRLILFLIPTFIVFIAKPVCMLNNKQIVVSLLLISAYCACFFVDSRSYIDYVFLNRTMAKEEMKPMLLELQEKIESDDTIYFYYGGERSAKYYMRKIKFNNETIFGIVSRGNIEKYYDDLSQLKTKQKVWLILSNCWVENDEIPKIRDWLINNGTIKSKIFKSGTVALEFVPNKN